MPSLAPQDDAPAARTAPPDEQAVPDAGAAYPDARYRNGIDVLEPRAEGQAPTQTPRPAPAREVTGDPADARDTLPQQRTETTEDTANDAPVPRPVGGRSESVGGERSDGARAAAGADARPQATSAAPGWRAGTPERHDVELNGRRFAEMYFTEPDRELREPLILRLPEARQWVRWVRWDSEERAGNAAHRLRGRGDPHRGALAARRADYYEVWDIPISDMGRAYFNNGHGEMLRDRGRVARDTAERVAGEGFTDVVMLYCSPESALDADQVARLPVVEGESVRYHYYSGGMAVTPGPNGGPPLIHVLPDAQGNPGFWLVRHPDGTVEWFPRTPGVPEQGLAYPDEQFINAPTAAPAGEDFQPRAAAEGGIGDTGVPRPLVSTTAVPEPAALRPTAPPPAERDLGGNVSVDDLIAQPADRDEDTQTESGDESDGEGLFAVPVRGGSVRAVPVEASSSVPAPGVAPAPPPSESVLTPDSTSGPTGPHLLSPIGPRTREDTGGQGESPARDEVSSALSVPEIIGIPPWIPPPSGGGGIGLLRSRAGKADSPPGRIGVHRQRPAGDW
ncbi:hypothetical protein [Streptomyces mirabilis]|uniref:hypothetical protein n=1 Tax=Streptomyces mirabilis TaxID=68239 RepID=UPI00225A1417|nr:hypothetical protein [Streptomyces mirabilis]MCX4429008.1 hypothetical protein [Streptomyces mirabilis]